MKILDKALSVAPPRFRKIYDVDGSQREEQTDAKEDDNVSPPPGYGVHVKRHTAIGSIKRPSRNNIVMVFIVDGYRTTFNATLQPSMPQFSSREATIFYDNAEDLTGTSSYRGVVGTTSLSICIMDRDSEIAKVEGSIDNPHLLDKHEIHGTGTWVST